MQTQRNYERALTFFSVTDIIEPNFVEMETLMSRIIRRIFPLLLTLVIIVSIGWYLFEYDPAFTRDILLQQARKFEEKGDHSTAVKLYSFAYEHTGGSDEVAIELAEKFKEIGNYSKAEYTLRKAIADGGTVELYMALSRTYVEQGKLRDAVLMLENANPAMKQQLDLLRPKAPVASVMSGSYREYLTVELTAGENKIYVADDLDYPSAKTDAYRGSIELPIGETTLFALSVGENGLVSPLVVYNYIIYDVVEVVDFLDNSFEAAVRLALGYGPSRVIYSDALWSIKELTLSAELQTTKDLKWLQNLEKLTIIGGKIDDPSPFSGLNNLQHLQISGTTVSSDVVEAIGTLSKLKTLILTECGISSISPLTHLTQLELLDLGNNAIRDITALSDLQKLHTLNLSSNALISLDGLTSLTSLAVLDVSFNSIVTTAPLAYMQSLRELNVSSNALRNLDSIGNLTQLKRLNVSYNELLDIDILVNCQNLIYLDVSHNTILNVDTAANLLMLEELDFSYNEVSQLPQFAKDHPLRILRAEYNQISSLKRLNGLKRLTHVFMDYNSEISSIHPLASCPSLKEVYVYGSKVNDVSELTDKGILVVYSPNP